MKYYAIFFASALFGLQCGENTNKGRTDDTITERVNEDTTKPGLTDREIIPGSRMGRILPGTSSKELAAIYGTEKILNQQVDEGEGYFLPGSILFPDTKDKAVITWKDTVALSGPERIVVSEKGAEWHIDNKIRIGTGLDKLVELNKKDFYITGCCFDFPFTVIDWGKGELSYLSQKGIILRLQPESESKKLKDSIVGERSYPVSKEIIKSSGMKVSEIIISLNE